MRGERLTFPPAFEIPRAEGIQCGGIDAVGQAVFLEREELAGMEDWRGVRDRAQVRAFGILHARVIRERIAIVAIELAFGRPLSLESLRLNPAACVVDRAVAEAEHADVAVRVHNAVVRKLRRIE